MEPLFLSNLGKFCEPRSSFMIEHTIESETDQDDIHWIMAMTLLYTSPAIITPFFHYEYLRIFVSLQSFQCRESLIDEISFRSKMSFKRLEKKNFPSNGNPIFIHQVLYDLFSLLIASIVNLTILR